MVVRHLLNRYIYHLHRNPWPTNILTTGTSIAVGDFIAQYVIERKTFREYDKTRTAQVALVGCVVVAPSLLLWYRVLDKLVKGTSKMTSLKKVVLDQMLYSPYILAAFFVSVDTLNRKSVTAMKERFAKDYINTQMDAYKFWPAAQGLNFCFVPSVYRILFLRFMAVMWNSFLCWSIHRKDFNAVTKTTVKTKKTISDIENQKWLSAGTKAKLIIFE